tara:strand:- start:1168 stop:1506 length:339 start_codon:yes stop_codon:yes gene_type:complete
MNLKTFEYKAYIQIDLNTVCIRIYNLGDMYFCYVIKSDGIYPFSTKLIQHMSEFINKEISDSQNDSDSEIDLKIIYNSNTSKTKKRKINSMISNKSTFFNEYTVSKSLRLIS